MYIHVSNISILFQIRKKCELIKVKCNGSNYMLTLNIYINNHNITYCMYLKHKTNNSSILHYFLNNLFAFQCYRGGITPQSVCIPPLQEALDLVQAGVSILHTHIPSTIMVLILRNMQLLGTHLITEENRGKTNKSILAERETHKIINHQVAERIQHFNNVALLEICSSLGI